MFLLKSICTFILISLSAIAAASQATEFRYQGTLSDGGGAANGNYDFEFRLFDAASGGIQLGSVQAINDAAVSDGAFTVSLDFGDQFPGPDRWIEIHVRQGADPGEFTILAPRQKIGSTPYAIRSASSADADSATTAENFTGDLAGDVTGAQDLTTVSRIRGTNVNGIAPSNDQVLRFDSGTNEWRPETLTIPDGDITGVTAGTGLSGGGTIGSVTLGVANSGIGTTQLANLGVTNEKIVSVSGAKVTGTVAPSPGSASYIQNSVTEQASSNFNISGSGTADVFGAATQYELGGLRIIGVNGGPNNLFVGHRSGASITDGGANSYFGRGAGFSTTSGNSNSFFGSSAGSNNSTGAVNSFFGVNSGVSNTAGTENAFFGYFSGLSADSNRNSFFGSSTGASTTTGAFNSFFGYLAGKDNKTGSANTAVGAGTLFGSVSLTNASAIGAQAQVDSSNSMVLGSIAGVNDATANVKVGIGLTEPTNVFTVVGTGTATGGANGAQEVVARFRQRSSSFHLGVSIDALTDTDPVLYLAENGAAKWGIRNDAGNDAFQVRYHAGGANTTYFGISTTGQVSLSTLGSAGSTSLCRNVSNQISTCSSSLRYKSGIENFSGGFDLLKRLQPVSFSWKDSGKLDLGLVAEEVAEIEPLLVTYNPEGDVEGVKYDRIGVVLVNVVKEQQVELEGQKKQVKSQNERIVQLESELVALKALVCASSPNAAACK